jgi:hypothetical protein
MAAEFSEQCAGIRSVFRNPTTRSRGSTPGIEMRRSHAIVAAAIAAVALFAAATISPSAEKAAPPPAPAGAGGYQMVAPLDAVMTVMSEVFKGLPDRLRSGTDKDFKDLKRQSLFVAEIGNLAGSLKEHAAHKEWKGFADAMKANGLALADAAGKKDSAKFDALFKAAGANCKACHDKYRDE